MFFRNLFNETSSDLQTWEQPLADAFGIPSSSGIIISAENSLMVGTIYACVNLKANTIAKLPLQVFKKNKNSRERATLHQVSYLLEKRPNPYQTPFVFKHTVTVHRNLWGKAYIRMAFNNRGEVIGLYLLEPSRTQIVADSDNKLWFLYSDSKGNFKKYDHSEIIYLPYLSTDGINGKSPITIARETAGTMKAAQRLMGSIYESGTMSTSVLKTSEKISPEAKKVLRNSWQEANAGLDNAGKVAILDGGFEYESIPMSLQDAEFVASQKFNIAEIARIFNVPLHMLNELDRSTNNNIEHQSMEFIHNTIQPELVAWEEEMNYKLFTTNEQKKYYVKFNLNSAMRGDSNSRATFYEKMLDRGAFSINKVLELEDMDGIGELGDIHRVDLNHVSIEIADEYQLAKSGALKGGDRKNEE